MSSAMNYFEDTNLVPIADACPGCGERDQDQLVWIDDDVVRCTKCGTQYNPLDEQIGVGDE